VVGDAPTTPLDLLLLKRMAAAFLSVGASPTEGGEITLLGKSHFFLFFIRLGLPLLKILIIRYLWQAASYKNEKLLIPEQ